MKYTKEQQAKIHKVMGEFKEGKLKSSGGEIVTDKAQALAISFSEAGISKSASEIEKILSIIDLAKSFETLGIDKFVQANMQQTLIEKSFSALHIVKDDEIEKGLDTSKLIRKKVQIHSSSGKIYEGYRWVSQETGQPITTGKESKETAAFKEKKQKEAKEVKKPKEKEEFEIKSDKDFANKIKEISEKGGSKSQRLRDLAGLGAYDMNLVMQLNPDVDIKYAIRLFSESGIDLNQFKETTSANIIALTSDKKVEPGETTSVSQLQDTMRFKDFQQLLKQNKVERATKLNLSDDVILNRKWNGYSMKLDMLLKDRRIKSLLAYGSGGVGKSWNMRKAIERANLITYDEELDLKPTEYDVVVKKGGKITPVALYKSMYEHNGKVIIFDDLDSMWEDQNMVGMLKGALEPEGDRTMTWEAKNPQKDKAGNPIPQSFKFKGQMIFISNKTREELSKIASPIVDSRASAIDLSMTMEQTLKKLDSFKYEYEFRDADDKLIDIPKDNIDDIMKFLHKFKDDLRLTQVNSRVLGNLAMMRLKLKDFEQNTYKDFEEQALVDMDLI